MDLYTQPSARKAPLEQLVLSQLEDIVVRERRLKRGYASALKAADPAYSEMWASEVVDLRLRTERLARMMDALEGDYAPLPPRGKNTNSAA